LAFMNSSAPKEWPWAELIAALQQQDWKPPKMPKQRWCQLIAKLHCDLLQQWVNGGHCTAGTK
jgi:hypothetical protein